MAKVAVVSGDTRGIGAAISKDLQAAGYTVVANYAGNDEAAAKFKAKPESRSINGMSRTTRPARRD
jgi:acetoacetyl-CoA reductase